MMKCTLIFPPCIPLKRFAVGADRMWEVLQLSIVVNRTTATFVYLSLKPTDFSNFISSLNGNAHLLLIHFLFKKCVCHPKKRFALTIRPFRHGTKLCKSECFSQKKTTFNRWQRPSPVKSISAKINNKILSRQLSRASSFRRRKMMVAKLSRVIYRYSCFLGIDHNLLAGELWLSSLLLICNCRWVDKSYR